MLVMGGNVNPTQRSTRRPGLWATVVVAWLVAAVEFGTIYTIYPVLVEPGSEHYAPGVVPRFIAWTVVLSVICVSSVVLLSGRRSARNLFLGFSTVLAVAHAWDGLLVVQYALSPPVRAAMSAWSWPQWWAFSTPWRWLAWLAGNFWYLCGRRTAGHFR